MTFAVRTALFAVLAACSGSADNTPGDAPTAMPLGSDFRIGVVGDTRPPSPDDVAGYPTAIITQIWDDLEQLSPRPDLAISTGDYQFSSPGAQATVDAQLDLYLGARAHFTNPVYPAMGNHECTGATTSNCGPNSSDGTTPIFTAFMSRMIQPLGFARPYYEVKLAAPDGTWTLKLVVIAANEWNAAQATWLETTLADPTTYTIIVRHEPAVAMFAPGVPPSEAILARHPFTLKVVGHVHTYEHATGDREVICGNGGAPPTSAMNYGYGIIDRLPSGALEFTEYDYASNAVIDQFSVNPDGSPAP